MLILWKNHDLLAFVILQSLIDKRPILFTFAYLYDTKYPTLREIGPFFMYVLFSLLGKYVYQVLQKIELVNYGDK